VFFNDLYSTSIAVVIYGSTLTFEIRDIAVPVSKYQNVLKWIINILTPTIKKLKQHVLKNCKSFELNLFCCEFCINMYYINCTLCVTI